MDRHVHQFFLEAAEGGRFYRVRALHDGLDEPYEELLRLAPALPRGWWELARLSSGDRIEFVRGFWEATLPYVPHVNEAIAQFFAKLDDIGIFLTQEGDTDPFVPQMVFSESGNAGFFRGYAPTTVGERQALREEFAVHPLPTDYLAFLKIHDGFSKVSDSGLIPSTQLADAYDEFQNLLAQREPLPHAKDSDQEINPLDLIPFYQSFGMDSFQCFYADWYPEQEMGNVYYSGIDHSLSNYTNRRRLAEHLAFPTFLDWFAFYLERVTD